MLQSGHEVWRPDSSHRSQPERYSAPSQRREASKSARRDASEETWRFIPRSVTNHASVLLTRRRCELRQSRVLTGAQFLMDQRGIVFAKLFNAWKILGRTRFRLSVRLEGGNPNIMNTAMEPPTYPG
jgi:hypothetical protein